jgi:hypothetical protein
MGLIDVANWEDLRVQKCSELIIIFIIICGVGLSP